MHTNADGKIYGLRSHPVGSRAQISPQLRITDISEVRIAAQSFVRNAPNMLVSTSNRQADFLTASPNNKIPAIVDQNASGGQISVFESGVILIYLAEKSGKLLAASEQARADALAWTLWQVGGTGPTFGQLAYFEMRAPEKVAFAIERFTDEAARLLSVLDRRLMDNTYLAGADYSIADIMNYPWLVGVRNFMSDQMAPLFADKPALARWMQAVSARPAVQRGLMIPE
jgi:GST-like protein